MTQPIAPAVSSVGESKTSASDSFESTHAQGPRTGSFQSGHAGGAADQLTVLVFKDNFTARTFKIPLKWINQVGWILAGSFLAVLLCIAIAIKLTVSARTHKFNTSYVNSDPQAQNRIQDLENQLKEAQSRIQTLSAASSAQAPQASASSVTSAPVTENSDAPVIDPALLSPSSPIANSKPFLFKGLPDQLQVQTGEVPITLGAPSARWNGKMLAVRFNLQYVSKNPGGQQGRIVILARGPGMMLAHPAEVFQEVGKDVLLNPNKGEYFSVSRYRETKADFGPIASKDSIKEVEVLVLSSTGQLLIHENIIPGKAPNGSAKRAAPATQSGSDSGPTTEDGEQ
ncbi:MAG: hypothetical protein ACJ763_05360 [Bdellovibrionia bacterium]